MTRTDLQISNLGIEPFKRALTQAQEQFRLALPSTVAKYLTPERMTRVVLSALARTPLLLQCTPNSVLKCVMESASLGLEPTGGVLGSAYMVPFRNKTGSYDATLVVGYRGLIDLARRSGELSDIDAHIVYEADEFELEFGMNPKLIHKPVLTNERGAVLGGYGVAVLKDESKHCTWMNIDEINAVRERSRARDNGPWKTDWEEMAKKTCVRRCIKMLPLSAELCRALDVEDSAEGGVALPPDTHALVPVETEPAPSKTSRIAAKAKANLAKGQEPPVSAEAEPPMNPDNGEFNYGPPPMSDDEPGSRG